MPGEGAEQFGVDGAVEPLDLPAALGSGDNRVDDPDLQCDGGAFQMVADEVGGVVDVPDVGDAAHRPGRVGISPDHLPQCQCGVGC